MNDNEFYEYGDRVYINPTLSSGEQEAFIDNLRNVQAANNAQIAQQTYNLGTEVPSNLGGLGGGEAYFTSRYQTPQVNEMAATLKSAAQAQALSDVMTAYQNQLQNQYKQAYRSAQRRARRRAAYGSGTGATGTTGGNKSGWNGDVEMGDGTTGSTNWLKGKVDEFTENALNGIAAGKYKRTAPPKESDYTITGGQQTQKVSEKTGIPEWLVNTLKIFG